MDGGVHFTDLMRYHLGCEAKELYAISKAYHPYRYHKPETLEGRIQVTNEDTVVALIQFEHGITHNGPSPACALMGGSEAGSSTAARAASTSQAATRTETKR